MNIKNDRFDWDFIFRTAHLTSGPNSHGLTVGKANPSPSRGMWNQDKEIIYAMATKYGYTAILDNPRVVSFWKAIEK